MSTNSSIASSFRPPEIGFTKTTLPNGLDVIVRRDARLPIVAVNLWYHVGSKDEERRQRGFAHLFEHLMFEGSQHFPGDFFKPLQRRGAGVNGSTSSDRTNYFVDLPAAHVELAVAMESDRMANLLPALDDHKLRVQKDVVKNEYRQNYANRPYGQAWRLLAEALYPPDHPYSWLTIGVMEDVEAATRDDVESFFRRYYVPSNASLCLVGDIEEGRALALAERYFGPVPGGVKARRPWMPEVRLAGPVAMTCHDRVELDRVYRTWPTVPHFAEGDASLVLLADVLTRGKSSRLYRKLVVDEQLAQDATAYQSGRELAGSFGLVITARPGCDLGRAMGLAEAELADIAARGVADDELTRVQNGRVAGYVYALDNIGGFGGVADRLNAYNTHLGDPGGFAADLERLLRVTPAAVQAAARAYLADRPSVSLTITGRSAATVATVPALDRAVAPEPAAAVPFRAPKPERSILSCGAELWMIVRRDLPIVAASAVVTAGASTHGPDRGGLASLTADLMDEGTTTRSALELALAAEGMGTSLSSNCGWDGSYVGMQCLTPHLRRSLELAADVLRNPAFPEPEWARVRGQTLAGLKQERDSAEALAYRALLRTLYGAGHPYRVPVDGTEASVAGLGREDLMAFHRSRYRPEVSAWVVAGDVDPDTLPLLMDGLLEGWGSAEGPGLPDPGREATDPGARIVLVDRPGAPQAVVRVGHHGLARLHPDHDDLQVWNQVLGGQFTSRLNEKIREEKGFTYGIRSHFDFRRGAGPFWIGSSLQADRLAEALGDIRAVTEDLLGDRPATAAELDDARRSLIEGQARQFETPSSLVARYAGLYLHTLPPDHHAGLADRLGAVTPESVLAAARRHVRPDRFVTVVVADAERTRPALEALGWGPVEVLRPEELTGSV